MATQTVSANGVAETATGAVAWTDPTNILAADGSNATVALSSNNSHRLTVTFTFVVPTGSTLTNFILEVKGSADVADAALSLFQQEDGVDTAAAPKALTLPEATPDYVATSAWETTGFTTGDLATGKLGFRFHIAYPGGAANISLDHIRCTLTYTAPALDTGSVATGVITVG